MSETELFRMTTSTKFECLTMKISNVYYREMETKHPTSDELNILHFVDSTNVQGGDANKINIFLGRDGDSSDPRLLNISIIRPSDLNIENPKLLELAYSYMQHQEHLATLRKFRSSTNRTLFQYKNMENIGTDPHANPLKKILLQLLLRSVSSVTNDTVDLVASIGDVLREAERDFQTFLTKNNKDHPQILKVFDQIEKQLEPINRRQQFVGSVCKG